MGLAMRVRRVAQRLATGGAALLLATSGLIAMPTPVAAAAHAVPWRFTTVTVDSSISGYGGAEYVKGWAVQCPAGYTPVAGGIAGGDEVQYLWRQLEWADPYDGAYHIQVLNDGFNGTTVTITALCVWADDIGTTTTVNADFARNSSGRAGGSLHCPEGTLALSAAVDWSYYSAGRTINFSTPITDGSQYGTGWFVEGYSEHSGATLGIELRCVDASLLTAEYATATDSDTEGYSAPKATCISGYRILTGGSAPPADQWNTGVDQGWAVSAPLDYWQYPARGYTESGLTLRALALCVPASTSSVTYTQTPAALSTQRNGTITFTTSDTAGETVKVQCALDGAQRACTAGSPVSFSSLEDGDHSFYVIATNQSGFFQYFFFRWTIDATAPTVTLHRPTSQLALNGPLSIYFSEQVLGVTASSVTVHAQTSNVDIPGTISMSGLAATWKPKAKLVPGETYRVSLSSAIHDPAGNPLIATYFTVRAATGVENTSVALVESWDLDNSSLASGGSYISSNLSGSRTDLTFTASAGQTVAVYGIRLASGGNADVYLDGVKKATASFYASSTGRARVYLSGALTAGTHTISVRPLGTKTSASTGTWVGVDDVAIGSTVKQESSLKQFFRRTTSTSAYSGSYDVMVHQTDGDTTPARFQVTVVGTGFKVYATKTSVSGSAKVYVDGVYKTTINLYSASTVYKALVYTGSFALGQHVIRLDAVGTSTGTHSTVNLDRISIT